MLLFYCVLSLLFYDIKCNKDVSRHQYISKRDPGYAIATSYSSSSDEISSASASSSSYESPGTPVGYFRNATYKRCPNPCQKSCQNTRHISICLKICISFGWECNPGYVLSDKGKCILIKECPECNGDPNAEYTTCPSACPRTCRKPERNQFCNKKCLAEGCQCKPGYVLNDDGKCIKPEYCSGCNGDKNAIPKQNYDSCSNSCDESDESCIEQCQSDECECKPGYILNRKGICVERRLRIIKNKGCKGDRNATYSKCPSVCQETCDEVEPFEYCTKQCLPPGCVCNEGYVKDSNGICILPEDCPIKNEGCYGDFNATLSDCPSACQTSCDHPEPYEFCTEQCLPEGCVCNEGYVKDSNEICILPEDCPAPNESCYGDFNATFDYCPSACQTTCDHPEPFEFCTDQCIPEGCICNTGYVKDSNGSCILPQDCPTPNNCYGDYNATLNGCPSACQQTCDHPEPYEFCTEQCLPEGCVCNEGYVKDSNGMCILPEDCPKSCDGDYNATLNECPSACQQTCDHPEPFEFCTLQCLPEGCVCNEGYVKDSNGICILPEDCPAKNEGCYGDMNATLSDCPSACQQSCDHPEPFKFCTLQCLPEGCVCNKGYVKDENGICILPEDCPAKNEGCYGDTNATLSDCPSACQRSCDHPEPYESCTRQCLPEGCVCNDGYVKDSDGKCILPEDCPDTSCFGDYNATYSGCLSACETTCDNPKPADFCTDQCLPGGCACNEGYVKDSNGICILPQDCPPPNEGCYGDYNATLSDCPSTCQQTCDHPEHFEECSFLCLPLGCVCNEGYVKDSNEICILPEDCPNSSCNGDKNAILKKCPNPCPPTCQYPGNPRVCTKLCLEYGCECKKGYFLNDDGKCVAFHDCPGSQTCTANETFVTCNIGCPINYCPKDDSRAIIACSPPYPCPSGCSCKADYLRVSREDDRCILSSDCPPVECTRPNEVWSPRPPKCLMERCTDIGRDDICEGRFLINRPRCICKPGFYRNDKDICISKEECIATLGCFGDKNATLSDCPSACQKTCDHPEPFELCTQQCLPEGCVCNEGYVKDSNEICILPEDCPAKNEGCFGDNNATFSDCPSACQRSCDHPEPFKFCTKQCLPEGCVCNEGYVKDISNGGKCILPEDCPVKDEGCYGDMNATFSICPSACQTTCENPEPVEICTEECMPEGCVCNKGYVKDSNGMCIRPEDCKVVPCEGDKNATFKKCPDPCPPTCQIPGGTSIVCKRKCLDYGCECNQGFYLNSDGKCVALQDCPEAQACSVNETFVYCNAGCPTDYCPEDDSRAMIACDPPMPCPSGCSCNKDYLRLSETDNRCILATECPPVECTRPNEVWSPRPPGCLFERCSDLGQAYECDKRFTSRSPKCICKPGFYRNDDDICIPKYQCPPPFPQCGENEILSPCKIVCPPQTCDSIFTSYLCVESECEYGCNCIDGYLRNESGACIPSEFCFLDTCDIPEECRATCANPNPSNCPAVEPSSENKDGCKCMPGYVLSDANGACITIEECSDSGCNGDLNAVITKCPFPSPSTCDSPYATSAGQTCDPVGCQCKPGYLLSCIDGECILPDQCPNGNPCGVNGTFSECAFRCPNQDCPADDSLFTVACKPGRPCPSGCLCQTYYKRRLEDDSCVLASDCPPVECTRSNEVFDPCASECLAENCDDLQNDSGCVADPNNCQPKCVCDKGYYRNIDGVCVPKDQCTNKCPVDQKCRPTCEVPNPEGCPYIPPADTNDDACNCQSGYVLSCVGGSCIKIEDCPTNNTSCNGDPNASIRECPQPCPSTCSSPDANPCKRKCEPVGCQCKPGYLLSDDGKCILPDECEGGNPCGPNGVFVDCRFDCPTNFCPIDDSRGILICESSPFSPCYSGCMCRLNYRFLSVENRTCIVSSDCPPVNCTRPNEVFDSCPSACLAENCEDIDNQPTVCNPLVLNCNPRCVCRKRFFRNSSDICVSARECRRLNRRIKQVPQIN